jgi:hypothetical protein
MKPPKSASSSDLLEFNSLPHLHSSPIFMPNNTPEDVLSWTSQDPRQSQLFSQWGVVVYRFQVCMMDIVHTSMSSSNPPQTDTNAQGQSVTNLWRAIRSNKEDRVAKIQWAPGGGPGTVVIGKVRLSSQRIPHPTCFLRSHLVTEHQPCV